MALGLIFFLAGVVISIVVVVKTWPQGATKEGGKGKPLLILTSNFIIMIPSCSGSQTVLPIVYPKLLLLMLDSMCHCDDALSSVDSCNSAACFRGYSVDCILHLCRYKWWVWFLFHCRITNVRITCFVSDFTVDGGDYRNGNSLSASPSGNNAVRDALFAVSFVISLLIFLFWLVYLIYAIYKKCCSKPEKPDGYVMILLQLLLMPVIMVCVSVVEVNLAALQ